MIDSLSSFLSQQNDKNDSNKDEVDSLEQLFSFLEMQASTGQW